MPAVTPTPVRVTHPHIAAMLDDASDGGRTYGSKARVRWHCSRGHANTSRLDKLVAGAYACAGCRSVGAVAPHIARLLDDRRDALLPAGSKARVRWHCSRGHANTSRLDKLVAGAYACAGCPRVGGYDEAGEHGFGYRAEMADGGRVVIIFGKTTRPRERMADYARACGSRLVGFDFFRVGAARDASAWERAIIERVALEGLEPYGGGDVSGAKRESFYRDECSEDFWAWFLRAYEH